MTTAVQAAPAKAAIPEIVGVQYLRGYAALAVVINHASYLLSTPKYFGVKLFDGVLLNGALGVDLFFLISGFIIAVITLDGETLLPRMRAGDFAWRRASRVLPMMWLAILSYAALRMLGRGTFHPLPYLRALTLFPAGDVEPVQIWSLRHELIFYVLFALSYMGLRRGWLLAAWFASPLVYAALSLPAEPGSLGMQVVRTIANPVNLEFAAGFGVALLWLRRTRGLKLELRVHPALVLLAMTCGYIAFGLVDDLVPRTIPDVLISCLFCAPILFVGVHAMCPDDRLSRVAEFLGDASYSIYLFHFHFLSALLGVWAKLAHGTPALLVLVGVSVASTAACCAIHWWVERPLVRLTHGWMRAWSGRRATAAA